jgi:hypothetical protein
MFPFRYPLAYSLVILPVSVARWLQYSHKDLPSAAMLFGQSMLNLSGAINVLLFLIIRPRLLLFASPENSAEPEAQILHLNTAFPPDTIPHNHRPGTTRMGLVDDSEERHRNLTFDGSRDSEASSQISSV